MFRNLQNLFYGCGENGFISHILPQVKFKFFKFEGLWDTDIGLYLAINKTPVELDELDVLELCPTRTTQRGRRPTGVFMFSLVSKGNKEST